MDANEPVYAKARHDNIYKEQSINTKSSIILSKLGMKDKVKYYTTTCTTQQVEEKSKKRRKKLTN